METHPPQPHAVLVSGPGLGHVNGCLLLAKALLEVGFSVTLACFARPYTAHDSKGRIRLPADSPIRLEVVPDGHPPIDDASYTDLFLTHPAMQDGLLQLVHKLAAEQRPATCLISDTIMAWPTQDVANEVGIPRVDFWTAAATSYLTVLALPEFLSRGLICSHKGPPPLTWKIKDPIFVDFVPGLAKFALDEIPVDFRSVESVEGSIVTPFLSGALAAKQADCVLIHSVRDLEEETFEALEHGAGMEAYAIGPLVHQYDVSSPANDPTFKWLDSQAPASVMYVAFGSNALLTRHEMVELALGIEASEKPFLWVIRSDAVEQGHELADVLPHGFQDRTAKRGLIVPWASQLAVLNHPAVGGFLSHCGWNSTLESLWMGVPVLAYPQRAEQPLNCRMMVKDWGTGIVLETSDEGILSKIQVEEGIRRLLEGEVGGKAHIRAKELSNVVRKAPFEGGQSRANLRKFAAKMTELSRKN